MLPVAVPWSAGPLVLSFLGPLVMMPKPLLSGWNGARGGRSGLCAIQRRPSEALAWWACKVSGLGVWGLGCNFSGLGVWGLGFKV